MNRSTPSMRAFAGHILAYETGASHPPPGKKSAVILVCEKMRPPLATLMGNAGYHALFSRALALAKTEIARVGMLQVNPEGALTGWEELEGQITPQQAAEAGIVLIAQLLGLLAAFIGEDLMLHQVREVWPTVPLTKRDLITR